MPSERRVEALLDRLGFTQNGTAVERRGYRFEIDLEPGDRTWRTWAWSLWAARLAVDQIDSSYDAATERSSRARNTARNVYEVPSRYGERERWLLPREVAETVADLAGKNLLLDAWVDERFRVAYGLEEGLGVHLLGERELDRMEHSRDDVVEKSRLAHFYASYKARPVATEKHEGIGKVKTFHTVDGRAGSRVLLFPDFDWDAAQDGGAFFLLGRDDFVVAEPFGETAAEICEIAAEQCREILPVDIPYYPTLYRLGTKAVVPELDAWEDPYAPPPDTLPVRRAQ